MGSSYLDTKVEIKIRGIVSSMNTFPHYIKLKNRISTLRLHYPDFMLETIRQYIGQKVMIQASGELDRDGAVCNMFINKITKDEQKW